MNERDPFEQAIIDTGFSKSYRDTLKWVNNKNPHKYVLYFEGYAYVVYQQVNLYITPVMILGKIYNKFKNTRGQIKLIHDVPIAHFRDAERFKLFMELVQDPLKDEEEIF